MDKKDAEMLARAICDEQDQRERDSKLVPSQEDILKQSRVRMREQQSRHEEDCRHMTAKQKEVADWAQFLGYLLTLIIIVMFILNQKLLFLIFMAGLAGICLFFRHRTVAKWKAKTWHCKNEKCDTSLWDGALIFLVVITVVCESILMFIF